MTSTASQDGPQHYDTPTGPPSTWTKIATQISLLMTTKLPALPTFIGEVLEWPTLTRIYKSTTQEFNTEGHMNRERLDTALKGPAARRVESHLQHTSLLSFVLEELEQEYGGINYLRRPPLKEKRHWGPSTAN